METKNQISKNNSLKKFLNRKLLSLLNSDIYLTNITFDMFNISYMKSNENKQHIVSFLIYLVNSIIEKNEGSITLNIIFDLQNPSLFNYNDFNDKSLKQSKNFSQQDLINIPFKDYERIFFLFYSCATLTKFIENKKFTVRFPQLLNYTNDSTLEYNYFDEIYNKILDGNEYFLVNLPSNSDILDFSFKNDKILEELINQDNLIEDINKKKFYYINHEDFIYYQSDEISITQETKISNEFLLDELTMIETAITNTPETLPIYFYDFVALGGTFDHFHMGHNMLLTSAALLSKKTIGVGVCSNEMIQKKAKSCVLQSYALREANVRESLEKIKFYNVDLDIFMLQDGVGKAGTDPQISALIVTGETLKGGQYVNEIRKKNGLNEIPLIIANLILENFRLNKKIIQDSNLFLKSQSQDFTKISSTSIRQKISENITLENIETLEKYWINLTLSILKGSKEICINWFSIIRDFYSQSWRKYHSLTHILKYITIADELRQTGKIKDFVNFELAVWFHDIIYTPSRNDNEERSCKEFLEFYENIKRSLVLENTLEMIEPNKVIKYIMATKSHFDNQLYDDEDLNYFLDADLVSLGNQSIEDYMNINRMIKYEFTNHLSQQEWICGRRKFLEMVLNKEHIYRTNEFRLKYEQNARKNIAEELELLEK